MKGPRLLQRLYLDHAATTPMLPAARAAMLAASERWANPSSTHAEGRAARAELEAARASVAAAYDWDGELLFTSGASESLALALGRANPARRIVSAVEHDAVIRATSSAATLPVRGDGLIDPECLAGLLDGAPALVAIQWANSETGVRQPIVALARVVHAAGGRLLLDAAQMPAGADPDAVAAADFVALSAHKRGGPAGVGALLVRDLATLTPTGGQERGYRPGTENVPAATGYAAALAEPEPIERWRDLRTALDRTIVDAGGESIANGSPRHPAIGAYRMPGVTATAQLIRFDLAGIAVSAGSACASGSTKPSHVLAALGIPADAAREIVRVSFGRTTTAADIERFIAVWTAVARGVRRAAA